MKLHWIVAKALAEKYGNRNLAFLAFSGDMHAYKLAKISIGLIIDSMTFKYRRKITITEQSGSDLTYYQVLIELNSTNFDFTHAQTNGEDLRFTDADGNLLDYWIEEWDVVNESAKVWVKVPSIPANSSVKIYMYYGNPSASSASDGDAVFEFFDDFEDYTEKWQEGGDSPTVSSETADGRSVVKITNGGCDCGGIETKENINVENRIIERMLKGWAAEGTDIDECLCIDTAWKNDWRCSDNLMHGVFDLVGGEDSHQVRIGGINSWGSKQLSPTEWKIAKTIIESGKITGIYDGEEISGEGAPTTYTGKILLSVDNNANSAGVYYDWIRVRKYTEPEPSVSLGAEETA